jgi:hypothetical protein
VQQHPIRLMTRQILIIKPLGLSYLHRQAIPYQVVAVLVVVGRVVGSWLECAARWGAQLGGVGRYVRQKSGISVCLKTDPWNIGQLNASCCPLAHMTD